MVKFKSPLHLLAALAAACIVTVAAASAGSPAVAGDTHGSALSKCTWSACSSDARWLRSVLVRAGWSNIGATGSALTTTINSNRAKQLRYLWATPGLQLDRVFKPLYRAGQVPIYSDGVRVVWRVQGVRVWIEPVPPRAVVTKIVDVAGQVRRR